MKKFNFYIFVIFITGFLSVPFSVLACENEKIVSKIRFFTDVGLSYQDLTRNLSLKPGERCTAEKMEQSIQALRSRDVFEFIEYDEILEGDQVQIDFTLIPYLILSKVEFYGNKNVSSRILRRALSVRPGDKFNPNNISEIENRILRSYKDAGYYNAKVKTSVIADSTAPLVRVEARITEGNPRRIDNISFKEGDIDKYQSIISEIRFYAKDKTLTNDAVREIRSFAQRSLRSKSFYQTRVSVKEGEVSDDQLSQEIVVRINDKNRLQFDITGNSYFSRPDLLESLKLDQRNVPIRTSVLDSLCREIREMHKEAGFLKAEIKCELTNIPDERYSGVVDVFKIEINEGSYFKVKEVKFEGNHFVSSSDLKNAINIIPGTFWNQLFGRQQAPTDANLSADEDRIKEIYNNRGFPDVRVRSQADIDEDEKNISVVFKIREKGNNRIDKVSFAIQYPETRDEEVVSYLTKWEKEVNIQKYDQSRIESLMEDLQEGLFELAYPNVSISYSYVKEENSIQFGLDLGEKVKIGKILLRGNFFTHDKIILRELSIEENDPWNPIEIDKSKQALYGLGIFRSVYINSGKDQIENSVEDLVVTVVERETGTFQGSVEFSTQDGVRLQTQIGQRNLLGDGRSLVLALDGFFRNSDNLLDAARTRLAYGSPKILDSPFDYGFEAFYQTNLALNESFKLDRFGVSNTLQYPFLESVRFSLSHSIYSERLFDVFDNTILGPNDTGTTNYSVFRASLEYDNRDDVFNPTSGYRVEVGAGYFPEWAGSEVEMFELSAQETTLLPVTDSLIYAFNVQGALRENLTDDNVVPLGSRYFIGGRNTLRGHTRFQVGPRALDGLVVGGDTFAVVSNELRYYFTDAIVGLLFVDVGQAFLRNEGSFDGDTKNRIKDLRISPGFGTQYLTPIGPLSAELGFATDREFGERFGRFIISIGSAF